ncbi:hypothetical protein BX285_6167 [Streptomyces sp. 1114.5]|uniref:hypothetical protein n=1 Tax=Streptomyces sp. 1114.5 TaxID=1938830 RepID=UPI000EB1C165|nr:hypothetical protein [Streptomyces sp. 1114.5]RKT12200.1 hypothetical protein BX285_6167 [Streptomyces sp. 1114.5]
MPSLLNYAILTDPTSLQASQPGAPSTGTVYVIVSNTHQSEVRWDFIDVEIPVGSGPDDLTGNPTAISATIEKDYTVNREPEPIFDWDSVLGRFRAHDSSGGRLTLPPEESLVLSLENIPVSDLAGLVRVKIYERSGGGDSNLPVRRANSLTTLGLVKQTPKIPRNFRPEKNSLVDVDAGQNLVLAWEGPDNLDYWIRDPQGNEVLVQSAVQGPRVTQQPYSWSPPSAPRRGTTYTLIAGTTTATQQYQGYFLTTTVHALVPEFDSGTRTPWVEQAPGKSRATFSAAGMEIHNGAGALGTVTADRVDVDRVNTRAVHGRTAGDGWIDFPRSGLNVHQGGSTQLGTLSADRAEVDRVNTKSVHGRNSTDGWIDFPQSGVDVHKDGQPGRGTIWADRADVNGVKTAWVQGPSDSDGWIEFPPSGLNVFHGQGKAWGTVWADRADLNSVTTHWAEGPDGKKSRIAFTETGVKITDPEKKRGTVVAGETNVRSVVTPWVSGPQEGAGWISFPNEGVDVHRDGEVSFGRIRYASYKESQTVNERPVHRRLPPYEWPPRSGN